MAYRKRSKQPIVFKQSLGELFHDEITVAVGASHSDIVAFAKKNRYRAELQDFIKNNPDGLVLDAGDSGYFTYAPDVRATFLILKPYVNDWDFWETLLHELNHAVFRFARIKSFEEETELQARLQTFLFRDIRRKLQGYKLL